MKGITIPPVGSHSSNPFPSPYPMDISFQRGKKPLSPPSGGSNVQKPQSSTKRCRYCGRENKAGRETCASCGALL